MKERPHETDREGYIKGLEAEVAMLRRRCEGMLEQGLSKSEYADVRFVFDDGKSHASGHRGILCAASEVLRGMFGSGMVEEREGTVRVPPGMSVVSFRGFLEWVYLGEMICVVLRNIWLCTMAGYCWTMFPL